MKRKVDQVHEAWLAGDQIGALKSTPNNTSYFQYYA
jgi:hypothetical protein